MGITNPVHLAFIAIIALIVLGPKRLPDLARSLGEGMRHFRESLESATEPEHEEVLASAMDQPVSPQAAAPAGDFPDTAFGTVSPAPHEAAGGGPAALVAAPHEDGYAEAAQAAPPYPHAEPIARPAPPSSASAGATPPPDPAA